MIRQKALTLQVTTDMDNIGKGIFQRAAEWGIPFGLYLTVAAVCFIYADQVDILGFVFMLFTLATPVVIYRYQRRKFLEDNGFTQYAALWMMGCVITLLGALVASLLVYLLLYFARPAFCYEWAQHAIEAYQAVPEMKSSDSIVETLQLAVEQKMLPQLKDVVLTMFWFTAAGGCVTSALTALIAQRKIPPTH